SHGQGLQDTPVQGGLEPSGGRVAWHKADVLLGISRDAKQEETHCDHHDRERPGRSPPVHLLQPTHHRRSLLLLQDDGEGQDHALTLTSSRQQVDAAGIYHILNSSPYSRVSHFFSP